MKIVVVGAGIGGLAAAACLQKLGHSVQVLEQAPGLGEVGAGIQMSANAVKVLNWLGLRDQLEVVGVKPKAFEFRRFDSGDPLHRIPLGDEHLTRHAAPYYQVHRGDLHRLLVDVVAKHDPASIRLNSRVTAVQELEDHGEVHTADGGRYQGELVVGADGIRSVVRGHVLGADQPTFTGQVAWRLTVPTASIPPALRTDIVSTIWCGPRNHAVMYYVRGGELLNFVGCVQKPWEEESWTSKKPWAELDQDYLGWHPQVRAVVDAVDKDQCYRWALNNRIPAQIWSTKRVTLLGDAVHATLPYMAQGAAMAIEDGAILARVLQEQSPLPALLKRYQEHRAPRTARVVHESTEMGHLYQIVDAAQMRAAFVERNIARSRNEWLYPYDPLSVEIH